MRSDNATKCGWMPTSTKTQQAHKQRTLEDDGEADEERGIGGWVEVASQEVDVE